MSDEVGDKWAAMPPQQHIPLSQYMLGMTMKAVALSTFGREMNDEKILKLRKAYQTVSICKQFSIHLEQLSSSVCRYIYPFTEEVLKTLLTLHW